MILSCRCDLLFDVNISDRRLLFDYLVMTIEIAWWCACSRLSLLFCVIASTVIILFCLSLFEPAMNLGVVFAAM